MNHQNTLFEDEILFRMGLLNTGERLDLLNFARKLGQRSYHREKYRRDALKQIREALRNQSV